MSENLKKWMLKNDTYKPKGSCKHKHNYSIKHLLIVTNINKHASAGYYLKKEYYYVLKCDKCNSFIPDIIPDNYQHQIFCQKDIDFNYPTITANTLAKNPVYVFSKLVDVNIIK